MRNIKKLLSICLAICMLITMATPSTVYAASKSTKSAKTLTITKKSVKNGTVTVPKGTYSKIVIAKGAAGAKVNLKNVTVNKVEVNGGKKAAQTTVNLSGKSKVTKVVAKTNTNITADSKKSEVGTVSVQTAGTVKVNTPTQTVNMTAKAANAKVKVNADADKVNVSGKNVTVSVKNGVSVKQLVSNADGTNVKGNGTVTKVTVKADNVSIDVEAEAVATSASANGTVVNGIDIPASSKAEVSSYTDGNSTITSYLIQDKVTNETTEGKKTVTVSDTGVETSTTSEIITNASGEIVKQVETVVDEAGQTTITTTDKDGNVTTTVIDVGGNDVSQPIPEPGDGVDTPVNPGTPGGTDTPGTPLDPTTPDTPANPDDSSTPAAPDDATQTPAAPDDNTTPSTPSTPSVPDNPSNPLAQSSEKQILTIGIDGTYELQETEATDATETAPAELKTYTFTVDPGTVLTAVATTMTVSENAAITKGGVAFTSGDSVDYSSEDGVTFTVTAQNGTTQDYKVIVKEATTNARVTIGSTTKYCDLITAETGAVALANAAEEEAEITLLQDVTLNETDTLVFEKNKAGITLNLNEHDITSNYASGDPVIVIGKNDTTGLKISGSESISDDYYARSAKVTIIGGNEEGTKGIIKRTVGAGRVIGVYYESDLVLDGNVTVTYNEAVNSGKQSAVAIWGDVRGTDNNGTVIEKSETIAEKTTVVVKDANIDKTTYGVSAYGACKLDIYKGAVILSQTTSPNDPNYAVGGNGKVTATEENGGTIINVHGGTIDGGYYNAGIYQPQNGTLTITGGRIRGCSGIDVKAGKVSISGNTTILTDGNYFGLTGNESLDSQNPLAVNDGANAVNCAVAIVEKSGYSQNDNVKVDISGGTFNGAVKMLRSSENTGNSYTLSITGGTFDTLPLVSDYTDTPYVATGTVKSGDTSDFLVTKGVASVLKSGKYSYYKTLQEAATASQGSEKATVTLLNDVIDLDSTVNFVKNTEGVTLDLNGHNIMPKADYTGIMIRVGYAGTTTGKSDSTLSEEFTKQSAVVTITDNSTGTSGTIKGASGSSPSDWGKKAVSLMYGSKLTLDGDITITYDVAANDANQSAVCVSGDQRGKGTTGKDSTCTKLTVNDVNITNTTFGVTAFGACTVDIKDGAYIESKPTVANDPCAAVSGNGTYNDTEGDDGTIINVSGGTITGGDYNAGIYQPQNGELNITGGTISGCAGIDVKAGTVNISKPESGVGPTIKANTGYYNNESTPNPIIKSGANAINSAIAIVEKSGYSKGFSDITVNILGGTINGAVRMLQQSANSGHNYTLTITGGTFDTVIPAVSLVGYTTTGENVTASTAYSGTYTITNKAVSTPVAE